MFWNDKAHQAKNAAKKVVKKVFPPKKNRIQVEAELIAELKRLEENYRLLIKRQLMIYRDPESTRREKERAKQKIEMCCGSLELIKEARGNLRDASSSAALAESMNGLGKSLKLLNRLYGASPSVRGDYLSYQIKRMNLWREKTTEDSDLRAVLDEQAMENMGTEWQKNVDLLIAGEIDVDGFMRRSADCDSPYREGGLLRHDEESEYEKSLRDLMDAGARPDSSAVEASADALRDGARELQAIDDYNRQMSDVD